MISADFTHISKATIVKFSREGSDLGLFPTPNFVKALKKIRPLGAHFY